MNPHLKKGLNGALVVTAGLLFMGCLEIKTDGAEGKDGDRVLFRFGDPRAELWGYNTKKKKPFPDDASIRWSTDRNDDMSYGNGKSRIKIGHLRPGKFEVKAKAQKGDKKVKDDIKIRILNDAPVVHIGAPAEGDQLNVAAATTFRGSATDKEDDAFFGGVKNLSWKLDGPTPRSVNAGTMLVEGLRPGNYTATLTATDKAGVQASAARRFRVVNRGPEGSISGEAEIAAGASVTLSGEMFDYDATSAPKDPNSGMPLPVKLAPSSLKWFKGWSSTPIGTGPSVTLDLAAGTGESTVHTIKLVGTDEFGAKGEATFRVTVKNSLPTATFLQPAAGDTFTVVEAASGIRMRASISDDDGHAVAEEKIEWLSNGRVLANTGSDTTNVLGAGTHRISVRATDEHGGVGTTELGTITVLNELPTVTITQPNQSFQTQPIGIVGRGQGLLLVATVNDPDGFAIPDQNVVWSSSLDGALSAKGPSVHNLLKTIGLHRITCTVTDAHGGQATSGSISINVTNLDPTISSIQVKDDSTGFSALSLDAGKTVRLVANASDPDGFELPAAKVQWTSNVDGLLAQTGTTIRTSDLSVDGRRTRHLITCTVTDAHGGTASNTARVTITNDPPVNVNIRRPRNNVELESGATVTLRGGARDDEDGPLNGESLRWLLQKDGDAIARKVATGRQGSLANLASGTYTLTLRAVDADGLDRETSVRFTIKANQPPVVTISSPAAQSGPFEHAAEIVFKGSANDPETGNVAANLLTWTATRRAHGPGNHGQGETRNLGSGAQVKVSDLKPGRWRVTLTAKDPKAAGITGEASMRIMVKRPAQPAPGPGPQPQPNQPPVVTIASPAANATFRRNEEITLKGSATDDGDAVAGANLKWTVQRRQGPGPNAQLGPARDLGAGAEVKTKLQRPGRYLVTLTVADNADATQTVTATVELRVRRPGPGGNTPGITGHVNNN